ncbi:MAG: preprotein translocase subunit YajC [Gemmatimonadaceae bacterium]|nr:preprotein translocase subunit YajC [Gemmatimonadaceae bacterium]
MIAPDAVLAVIAQQAPGGTLTPFLVEVALLIGIFYLLMVRPQQKQRKQHEASLRALKRGDEVVTAGGIVAEVIHIKETVKDGTPAPTMDDRITIKSGESRLVVERGRIARVIPKGGDKAADTGTAT